VEFRADLHCHSSYSDGTKTPKEILFLAKEKWLKGLSITDHDTVDGYREDLFLLSKKLGIELITGVEISALYERETIHILGYNFDYRSSDLKSFLKDVKKKRFERNMKILENLEKLGMKIEEKELKSLKEKGTFGRPQIADLMVSKGYAKSFKEAFQKYLKDGGKCFVLGEKYSVKEVIDKLHEVKAKAILAHPHQIKDERVLREVLNLEFDGVEVHCGYMNFPGKWVDTAREKNWIMTGGSDFHGSEKTYTALGSSYTSKEMFDRLKD
jgi:predicted metal-dependent phosphoesterase TrpH